MKEEFIVTLHWYGCGKADDARWSSTVALYAYLAPARAEIYYLGKCYGTSVRQRWNYDAKHDVWDCIEKKTKNHCPIVAEFELPRGARISKQLVSDVESLLIFRLKPPCNVQCISSRGSFSRPDTKVVCSGDAWPLSQKIFRDDE